MAEWLAANNWAVPYRNCKCEAVRDFADLAKATDLGIWKSEFKSLWDWCNSN